MRNFTSESRYEGPQAALTAGADWTSRTEADFKSVLLELARAQRGFLFYDETDARRRDLADRAHRALSGEINRGGPIEFSLQPRGFGLRGHPAFIESTGALVGLEAAFRSHGLLMLQLDPELTGTALAGFLDQLGHVPTRYAGAEHFARTLAARDSQGIRINGLNIPGPTTRVRLTATPPHASASLGPPPASKPLADAQPPLPHAGEGEDSPQALMEDAPLSAPASDDRGERLRARLIELQATTNDPEYLVRIADIVVWAEDLWNDDAIDDYYRALLVLADHAVGCGGRSGVQARAAAASFANLANSERLADLIRRATLITGADASRGSVRAAQLLLQLGEVAVPALFDRICTEGDPDRAAPLRALLLTQGEIALPTLIQAIKGRDERRARHGIRLAGELQNAKMLPVLLETLAVPDLSRRIETIRALSLLPGEESGRALTEALSSDLEQIAAAASEALAKTDGGACVPALLDVLEASLQSTKTKLGTTLVSVLGRIGDERAVPRLCSILERRPVLRRAHWHAIQLATVDALSVLPTKEARRSLERAASHAPMAIRDRARSVLAAQPDRPPRPAPSKP